MNFDILIHMQLSIVSPSVLLVHVDYVGVGWEVVLTMIVAAVKSPDESHQFEFSRKFTKYISCQYFPLCCS